MPIPASIPCLVFTLEATFYPLAGPAATPNSIYPRQDASAKGGGFGLPLPIPTFGTDLPSICHLDRFFLLVIPSEAPPFLSSRED